MGVGRRLPPQAFHTLAHQFGDVEQEYDEMELVMHIGLGLVYCLCVRPSSKNMAQQMNSNVRHAIKEIDLVLTDVGRYLETLGQHSGVKHGAVHKQDLSHSIR